ncbi:MAG TPA: hypothetical protein VLG46_16150 [Anaerolineae bacterium]|nr:hypothetical protein [Anaerolineae bacterium]
MIISAIPLHIPEDSNMDRSAIVSRGWNLTLDDRRLWGVAALVLISEVVIGLVLPGNFNVAWTIVNQGVSLLLTAFLNGILICMIAARLELRSLTVTEGLKAGLHWLLPIFVLNLLLQFPARAMLFVTQGTFTASTKKILESSQAGVWVLSLAFILLVSLLCSSIAIGAERAVILEGRSIGAALFRGWRLLWTYLGDFWGISIRLFLIALGIGLASGCVIGIFGVIATTGGSPGLTTTVSSLAITVLSVFFVPFTAATWTLAFREWQVQERSELPAALDVTHDQ